MGAIQLIRHGQASWGAADYDRLSALGTRQGSWLGQAWEAGDFVPTWSVVGGLKRHAQTAVAALDAVDGDLYDIDTRWDEFDHRALFDDTDPAVAASEFAGRFDAAIEAWMRGESAVSESFVEFEERVMDAFLDAVARAEGEEVGAIFTSGGPISIVASHLLTGTSDLFIPLSRVMLNGGVTTVVIGQRGPFLLSFNEHTHLPRTGLSWR